MSKIINWQTEETIIEDENLTIKELVEKAVRNNMSLVYADLRGADLRGANLIDANLKFAYLWGANLIDANLKDADLWGADLWGAKINEDQKDDLLKAMRIRIK